MGRELLILRHAKSSWSTASRTDHERPLKKRGRRDAPRIGEWIAENDLFPDLVLSSSAVRALETAHAALDAMGLDQDLVTVEENLYHPSLETLLGILATCPKARRTLLVGHNPGFEELILHLAAGDVPTSDTGKVLPTAALAHLRLPNDWSRLPRGCGKLLRIVYPRELG
jgi:phosphohistidine phosphatase